MATRTLAGRYELLSKIGEGGMAVVFRAKDVLLSRNVAVKILRPEFTTDNMFIDSFRRESQLAASIVDPNIVNVYDVGREGNIYYIVMELVEGEPLSEIIKREAPLEPRRAANICRQIAMALSTAHKHQLIHRDVKPHNILISEGDHAKISDFGIAQKIVPEEADTKVKKKTVMGSIHYFSPEQARGAYVDERSDIYSLGIVLYEMLTGKVPFDGDTPVDVALKHMNQPITPPSQLNPDIPADLERIVLKATAKLQKDRYSSADELITDLNFVKFSRQAGRTSAAAEPKQPEETAEERKARILAEKKERQRKRLIRAAAIGAGAILLIILLVLFIQNVIKNNDRNAPVATPYLVGMQYEAAQDSLKKMGLQLEIEAQKPSDDPAGSIISQTPKEDTMVRPGQIIKVTLSLGPVDNAVPLLIGRTQTAAQSLLWSYGFELGEVTGAYSNEYAKGQIISQDPEAGAHLEKGGKVNITVSLGPEESGDQFTVTVPKLTQQTLEDARAAITKAGLVLDQVTYQDSTTVEKDRVISQSISAGSTVDKGSKINLVVSKGIAEPRTLSIKLDYAQAKEENFRVSVTLTDQGETTNVFVEQRSRSSASDTVQITGKGENSKVTVFFSYPSGGMDAVRTYSVNFRTGEIKEQ